MNFKELINKRYSVRAYKSVPIEDEKIQQILEAARLAPTASNRQPFQIIVISSKGKEDQLQTIYPRDWFVNAPIILCLCGLTNDAWVRIDNKKYLQVDIGIVMDHIILAATDLGLGTCFIAAFNEVNARKILQLPEDVEPILFTPLGYPDDSPKARERKSLEELVRYEHW